MASRDFSLVLETCVVFIILLWLHSSRCGTARLLRLLFWAELSHFYRFSILLFHCAWDGVLGYTSPHSSNMPPSLQLSFPLIYVFFISSHHTCLLVDSPSIDERWRARAEKKKCSLRLHLSAAFWAFDSRWILLCKFAKWHDDGR